MLSSVMKCIRELFVATVLCILIIILLFLLRKQTNEKPLYSIKDIEINNIQANPVFVLKAIPVASFIATPLSGLIATPLSGLKASPLSGLKATPLSGLKASPLSIFKAKTTVSVFKNESKKFLVNEQNRSLMKQSPVSKDLVIHRVYFDDRKKEKHKNQTVFFIDTNWTIYTNNWIVGCGINNQRATDYLIRLPAEFYWIRGNKAKAPNQTVYEHMYVDCYDLPAKSGDRAFLIYKTSNVSQEVTVESEYPLIFPKPPVIPPKDGYNVTVVVCIKANSKAAPFLGEIIHYQKSIGVDHISLIALSTFIKDGGLIQLIKKHPYIFKYFVDGFVSIDLWKSWYNETEEAKEIRLFSESIRKVACTYEYRGTYDYSMPIDTDDFFTPRIKNQKNIKYYINSFCRDYQIGSCTIKWINYFPDFCGLNAIPKDGNVTKALKSLTRHKVGVGKSIHKTSALLDATFHDARPRGRHPSLVKGYYFIGVKEMYCSISHIRKNAAPKYGVCDERNH